MARASSRQGALGGHPTFAVAVAFRADLRGTDKEGKHFPGEQDGTIVLLRWTLKKMVDLAAELSAADYE